MNNEFENNLIEKWANIYKDTFVNESFANKMTPEELIRQIQEEATRKSEIKIVINGKFFDIKDIYTIDDDTNRDYLCIEAATK